MLSGKNFINEKVGICENTNSYDFGNGLVGYRPLSTNTDDVAGGNNGTASGYVYADGTVAGNVTMGEDNNGKYVYCDGTRAGTTGTNAQFNLGNPSHLNFQPTNSFELVWKGKVASFPTTQSCGLFGRSYSATINLYPTGRISFGLRNASSTSQQYITPNNTCLVDTVYTLGLSYDGSAKKLYAYINGVLQNAGGLSITLTDFNNTGRYLGDQAQIGGETYSQPTTHYFAGIFNRQLTDSERTLLMNKAKDDYSPVSSGLVGRWSGKDYAGTSSVPTTLYDKNNLVQGNIAGTSAYNFDGVDDYIQLLSAPNSPFANTGMQLVSVVAYIEKISDNGFIFAHLGSPSNNRVYITRESNNNVRLNIGQTAYDIMLAANYNNGRHHIVIIRDATNNKAYAWFDGVNKINGSAVTIGTPTYQAITYLGRISGGADSYTGAISNCMIKQITSIPTDAEILALYNKINQYG